MSPPSHGGHDMSRVSQLYDLQQIDTGIDKRIARMRQLDEQMVDSPELIAARAAHDQARALLSERQATLKRLSHEAEEVSKRLKSQEKVLYGGTVKNPKELSQVQEEVGHLKIRLKSLEDSALDAMLAVEDAETDMATKIEERDKVKKDWQHLQTGLLEEKDKL